MMMLPCPIPWMSLMSVITWMTSLMKSMVDGSSKPKMRAKSSSVMVCPAKSDRIGIRAVTTSMIGWMGLVTF